MVQRASLPKAGGGSNRFEKRQRLLDKAAYERVFRGASRSRDTYFTVLFRRRDEEIPRLGLAIAKKHCKQATARNRIKRIVRESFRHHQALLAGLDIVVMNQPAARLANNQDLFASLEQHWRRLSAAQPTPRDG